MVKQLHKTGESILSLATKELKSWRFWSPSPVPNLQPWPQKSFCRITRLFFTKKNHQTYIYKSQQSQRLYTAEEKTAARCKTWAKPWMRIRDICYKSFVWTRHGFGVHVLVLMRTAVCLAGQRVALTWRFNSIFAELWGSRIWFDQKAGLGDLILLPHVSNFVIKIPLSADRAVTYRKGRVLSVSEKIGSRWLDSGSPIVGSFSVNWSVLWLTPRPTHHVWSTVLFSDVIARKAPHSWPIAGFCRIGWVLFAVGVLQTLFHTIVTAWGPQVLVWLGIFLQVFGVSCISGKTNVSDKSVSVGMCEPADLQVSPQGIHTIWCRFLLNSGLQDFPSVLLISPHKIFLPLFAVSPTKVITLDGVSALFIEKISIPSQEFLNECLEQHFITQSICWWNQFRLPGTTSVLNEFSSFC